MLFALKNEYGYLPNATPTPKKGDSGTAKLTPTLVIYSSCW